MTDIVERLRAVAERIRASETLHRDDAIVMGAANEIERLRAALYVSAEPVAWLWQHSDTGRTRIVTPDQIITTDATWTIVGPLYLHSVPQPEQPVTLTDEQRCPR